MRSPDTKAITITLPMALFDYVEAQAKQYHCGNVSAVIRAALYKQLPPSGSPAINAEAASQLREAEGRTKKYRTNRFRPKSSRSKPSDSPQANPVKPNAPHGFASDLESTIGKLKEGLNALKRSRQSRLSE